MNAIELARAGAQILETLAADPNEQFRDDYHDQAQAIEQLCNMVEHAEIMSWDNSTAIADRKGSAWRTTADERQQDFDCPVAAYAALKGNDHAIR